jgi:hypothetical protein
MKNFLMTIYSIILSPSFSANQIIPKLCIDCKFYKKGLFTFSKFGKCTLFPTVNEPDYFLVNGKNKNNIECYHYCSTARNFDSMCGKEGKFYEKNEKKDFFEI